MECEICQKKFSSDKALKLHKKTIHSDITFNCNQCSFVTNRQDSLRRHKGKCGSEKVNTKTNHLCDVCGFTTTNNVEWFLHQKTHREKRKDPPTSEAGPSKKPRGEPHYSYSSCFKNQVYKVTFKPPPKSDPLSVLEQYKATICDIVGDHLNKKGPVKMYIVMQVKLYKLDKDGTKIESEPHFHGKCRIMLPESQFENLYLESANNIMEAFAAYLRQGSGWILDHVPYLYCKCAKH